MEAVVHDMLMKYRNQLNLTCQCDRCLADIKAITLNKLEPRYIADKLHSPYVRAAHEADHQGATNILSIIAQAATVVSNNPRCNNVKERSSV